MNTFMAYLGLCLVGFVIASRLLKRIIRPSSKSPASQLLSGDAVMGRVINIFNDIPIGTQFVVQLSDNSMWDVFDSSANYVVGESVIIKRLVDRQYFV